MEFSTVGASVAFVTSCFFLTACGSGSSGSESSPISEQSTPLESPTNITAEVIGQNIEVSWSEVEGAEAYHLYFSTEPGLDIQSYASFDNGSWLKNVQNPAVITEVDLAQTYYVSVTSVRGEDESKGSPLLPVITRYVVLDDASIVRDVATGLEWKRCREGYEWGGQTQGCEGNVAKYTIEEVAALDGDTGWRVPEREEYQTLVFCSSGDPAAFPKDSDYSSPQDACSSDSERPRRYKPIFMDWRDLDSDDSNWGNHLNWVRSWHYEGSYAAFAIDASVASETAPSQLGVLPDDDRRIPVRLVRDVAE